MSDIAREAATNPADDARQAQDVYVHNLAQEIAASGETTSPATVTPNFSASEFAAVSLQADKELIAKGELRIPAGIAEDQIEDWLISRATSKLTSMQVERERKDG